MKHLGDITKINGEEIEPVWCITGGSPCQDLSVAGKRAGLAGERSGLFMEQVRIVKEMRSVERHCAWSDEPVRLPRFMVWENVYGAFSSNGGEDFRCVLEEIVHIAEPGAVIPRPSKGKWTKAGIIVGDGWSVGWRTHDAQFWGVPQRRKRISLVADFGSECVSEILFEQQSLSRDSSQGFRAWQRTAENPKTGAGTAGGENERLVLCDQGGKRMDALEDKTATLRAEAHHPHIVIENHPADSRVKLSEDGVVQTITGRCGTGGGNVPLLMEQKVYGVCSKNSNSMKSDNPHSGFYEAETTRTLDSNGGRPDCAQGGMAVVSIEGNGTRPSHNGDGWSEKNVSYTLNATEHHGVAYGIGRDAFNQGKNALYKPAIEEEVQPTLVAKGPGAVAEPTYSASKASFFTMASEEVANTLVATDYKDPPIINDEDDDGVHYIVRRLTPLECERLQGFPDGWTDIGDWTDSEGKKHKGDSDSPRYKALGNSIALPFWKWMFRNMAQFLPKGATMGSLFDGVGGFPLCWEEIHGKGTARWASEIEEFPISVTKERFGEE